MKAVFRILRGTDQKTLEPLLLEKIKVSEESDDIDNLHQTIASLKPAFPYHEFRILDVH